jgi:hypothetical protein
MVATLIILRLQAKVDQAMGVCNSVCFFVGLLCGFTLCVSFSVFFEGSLCGFALYVYFVCFFVGLLCGFYFVGTARLYIISHHRSGNSQSTLGTFGQLWGTFRQLQGTSSQPQ